MFERHANNMFLLVYLFISIGMLRPHLLPPAGPVKHGSRLTGYALPRAPEPRANFVVFGGAGGCPSILSAALEAALFVSPVPPRFPAPMAFIAAAGATSGTPPSSSPCSWLTVMRTELCFFELVARDLAPPHFLAPGSLRPIEPAASVARLCLPACAVKLVLPPVGNMNASSPGKSPGERSQSLGQGGGERRCCCWDRECMLGSRISFASHCCLRFCLDSGGCACFALFANLRIKFVKISRAWQSGFVVDGSLTPRRAAPRKRFSTVWRSLLFLRAFKWRRPRI